MSAANGRSGPGRRAVLRWAWRLFRREWRQQLLVLGLITVAVAAAVGGSSMAINAASQSQGQFGDAKAIVHLDATHPTTARAGLAETRRRFGQVEVIGHTPTSVPGVAEPIDVRSQDPHGRYGRPMLALRSGRYPTRADEVALTTGAEDLLSSGVGHHVRLGGVDRIVVGHVENPADLSDQFALLAPSATTTAESWTLLLESDGRGGPPATAPSTSSARGSGGSGGPGLEVMVPGSDKASVVATVLVATTLAMALVCLIAAAGFVVVAHRRQRQLGLLAAIGATQRHLRLVMLGNGAIVGVASALLGGAFGVLGWMAAAPGVETAAGHRIDRLDLPWTLIAACMGLAVVAAIVAAWWPARTMARQPIVAALSRRPVRSSPVHRSLGLAVVLIAVGMATIGVAQPTTPHVRPLVLIVGLVAVVIGVVLASPAAIRALAAPAGRLPFATRLALRDLVRYQARAAAALAAITLALSIAVAVVVVAKSSEPAADAGNLSSRQLVLHVGDRRTAPDPNLTDGERAQLDASAAKVAANVVGARAIALDVAVNPSTAGDAAVREPVSLVRKLSSHSFNGLGFAYVATPELLRHLGIDPTTVRSSTELLTSRTDDVLLLDMTVRRDPAKSQTHVQRVDLPTYTSAPTSLITARAIHDHGWVRVRAGWLIESSTALTPDQIDGARRTAAALGFTIETRSGQDALATLRAVATAVGGLLALAIVVMTIGLIRSEAAGDLRTLTATGAAARTRRTVTASTAGALALLGVILSTAGAYLALGAAFHADLARLVPVPLAELLALGIGLPVAATIGGWLLAGREPRTFARQSLD